MLFFLLLCAQACASLGAICPLPSGRARTCAQAHGTWQAPLVVGATRGVAALVTSSQRAMMLDLEEEEEGEGEEGEEEEEGREGGEEEDPN